MKRLSLILVLAVTPSVFGQQYITSCPPMLYVGMEPELTVEKPMPKNGFPGHVWSDKKWRHNLKLADSWNLALFKAYNERWYSPKYKHWRWNEPVWVNGVGWTETNGERVRHWPDYFNRVGRKLCMGDYCRTVQTLSFGKLEGYQQNSGGIYYDQR